MATKQFYATGSFKYANRMLTSGDGPFPMDGPTARLYIALGKISPNKPRTVTSMARPDADGSGNLVPTTAALKPKRAPRKRAAKKSK
jgi:hypothetical protein